MSTQPGERSPQDRVWSRLPPEARDALREGISPTDLQTLMIDVAQSRARAVTPARLMERWANDRFCRPTSADPRALAQVESTLWSLLPADFVPVELSPLVPLGTTSALTPLDQNRVVTTVRGTEVLSDPTNALAIEAATRRSAQGRHHRVDLATSHRVIRAQRFDRPGLFSHFKLFALVSSARDRGSGLTEAAMFADHVRFYASVLREVVPSAAIHLVVSTFERTAMDERLDEMWPELIGLGENIVVRRDTERIHARGYYTSHALRIDLHAGDGVADLGDGGLTNWTALLLSDAKERCLTSCISVERLADAARTAGR